MDNDGQLCYISWIDCKAVIFGSIPNILLLQLAVCLSSACKL